jgi:hypothetical protein
LRAGNDARENSLVEALLGAEEVARKPAGDAGGVADLLQADELVALAREEP